MTIHDRIQTQQNLFLHPVPIQTQGIDTIPIIYHETHHTTEIETIQTVGIEVILTIEIRIIQTTDQGIFHIIDQIIADQLISIKTDHEIIHKIETQVTTIDTEIIPSHHIGIITVTPILNIDTEVTHQSTKDTKIKCKQMKKQLQTPQVLIDDTGSNELQLNHINCESTDTESDTDITISVNMITVENDYEPIIYEQPFTSHIYKNQLERLHNYYIGPINNNTQTTQEVNKIHPVIKPDKKRRNTMLKLKTYLSKYTERTTQRKNLDNSISLRKPKKQRISTTRS